MDFEELGIHAYWLGCPSIASNIHNGFLNRQLCPPSCIQKWAQIHIRDSKFFANAFYADRFLLDPDAVRLVEHPLFPASGVWMEAYAICLL